ncbi:MAG TPA: NUDIX hydrolase, partial [Candidatus Saccharimonadia bacterium]|nr:NUDIX hydrolase [Candidatus Saccharimonadia bacterium]
SNYVGFITTVLITIGGQMREIKRTIASAVIFSADGLLLMGRKDSDMGGEYPGIWHIPGGGVEPDETLDQALVREVGQEVVGLDLTEYKHKPLRWVGLGSSPKTMPDGERVLAHMKFHRFEVHLDESAAQLEDRLRPGDDLVELRWFTRAELAEVISESDINAWFEAAGYIDPE